MMIGEKARAALYLFSFALRTLYTLLAMWDDFYATGQLQGIVDMIGNLDAETLVSLIGGLAG